MSKPASDRLAQVASHISAPASSSSSTLPAIAQYAPDSVGKRLQGKIAIITGCNSALGIGRATAHQYAHNGVAGLYICDYDDSNLPALEAELKSQNPGVKIHARKFDAAEESEVEKVVNEAITTYGRLDIFFANAGITGGAVAHVRDIEARTFMNTMRVNSLSVFLAVKHASKAMMVTSESKPKSGGSIICTASTAGVRSGAGGTDYSASKAAVISIVQTSAYQLAGTDIRCNAICPGIIETGMTAPVYEMARKRGTASKIGQLNPLRRGGVPDEIARVALFLGSDESSYVNAQYWLVDGGLSGSHPVVPGKIA
ncbi:hypothetical protein EDC01DRAFT_652998 [Geopyxis carbonaria]|nr:hypothetical protein EDC01DRAFT_652998 [Geopyxis carbonaria]